METIPPTVFVMAGAILAAVLTGIFSFVSLVLSKEQKISEFRQQWIDSLRNEIGILLANVETLTRLAEYKLTSLGKDEFTDEELSTFRIENKELYIAINESKHKVAMRINPKEHESLYGKIDTLVRIFTGKCGNVKHIYQLIDEVMSEAQTVLKKEWVRVKKGEFVFRLTGGVIILGLLILVFVGYNFGHEAWELLSNNALNLTGTKDAPAG